MEVFLRVTFTSLLTGSRLWAVSLAGLFGMLFGLGGFTFTYAEGTSYLSDDPDTCINCHIMREQYDGWTRSSHRSVATCNDCHIPHRFPDKWIVKGLNGWNHSRAFTTGDFPEPIMITERNARIARESCLECHSEDVSYMAHNAAGEELDCIACHGGVGHDEFPNLIAGR